MADALVTVGQLATIASRASPDVVKAWHAALVPEMRAAEIVTDARQAPFLASTMNETGGLLALEETSYFNTGFAYIKTKVFPGVQGLTRERFDAWRQLGRRGFDEAFFNHVYADANRSPGLRLGNTQPGDGYRYRGQGPNQLTGRGNFTWMARETGLPLVEDPAMIMTPAAGAKIACHFWRESGCNELVDDGSDAGALRAFRTLNAGLGDFTPHLNWLHRCRGALANDDLVAVPPPRSTPSVQRRDAVMAMQAALVERGFDTGGVDGIVGPKTRAALAAWMGLPTPGAVDDEMLQNLGLA